MISLLVSGTLLLIIAPLLSCRVAIRRQCLHLSSSSALTEAVTNTQVSTNALEDALQILFSDSMSECEDRELQVIGAFPAWLEGAGALLRNGPGCFGEQESDKGSEARRYTHVFDGLAKLTRYEICDGGHKVRFTAKFLRTAMYKGLVQDKSGIVPSVTTGPIANPEWGKREGLWAAINSKAFDNVPVNIHKIGGRKEGRYVGTTDAPILVEFDPRTLETVSRREYGRAGKAKVASFNGAKSDTDFSGYELFSTAHPKATYDGESTLNYFLDAGLLTNTARIVKINKNLERTIVGSVPLGFGQIPYVHDLSLTADDRYVLLAIFPLTAPATKMANGKGFLPQLQWQSEEAGGKTTLYVFDLHAVEKANQSGNTPDLSPIATFEGPAQFAYHHVNAFVRPGNADGKEELVLDLTAYNTPDIISGEGAFAYIPVVRNPALRRRVMSRAGETYRYSLPLPEPGMRQTSPVRVTPKRLAAVDSSGNDYDGELHRINPRNAGKKYRYSYSFTAYAGDGEDRGNWLEWAIVKLDTEKAERGEEGATASVWRSRGVFTSEPIFVPHPDPGVPGEDKGVLLVQCYDAAKKDSFLLCLDAETMTELGRAYTNMPCPISFHGQWAASDE
jgi:torulene dioxygenase